MAFDNSSVWAMRLISDTKMTPERNKQSLQSVLEGVLMEHKPAFYEKYIKRALDVFLSGVALVALSPVLAITALLVRFKLGSPVIFRQDRPGKNGEIFHLYKLRTMTDARDENGDLLPDEVRLTKFGRLLRSTSLDELPELWNIFRGDMSIVGPRPLLVEYLPYYTQEEMHRHDVVPGLTGWAQVNGRNNLTWEQKFAYDLEYVNNISFGMDVKIVWLTVKKVLTREDVQTDTQSTEGNLKKIRMEADSKEKEAL